MTYILELMDGTSLTNLSMPKPNTFTLERKASAPVYFQLNDDNLKCATLYDEEGNIVEIYIDATMQNFSHNNGVIQFKLTTYKVLEEQEKHRKEKEQRKRRDQKLKKKVELEIDRKGW